MIKALARYSFRLASAMLIFSLFHWVGLYLLLGLEQIDILFIKIYLPWFLLSVISFYVVFLVQKSNSENIGFAYLVSSILKMLIALIYLLPELLNQNSQTKVYALNFVLVFFFLLIFELLYIISVIKNSQKN